VYLVYVTMIFDLVLRCASETTLKAALLWTLWG